MRTSWGAKCPRAPLPEIRYDRKEFFRRCHRCCLRVAGGLFADAQLGQDRELIKVTPKVYDFAIAHLGEQRARDPYSSPGRGDGLSRDGSKPLGVGTAPRPVGEDVIALGRVFGTEA